MRNRPIIAADLWTKFLVNSPDNNSALTLKETLLIEEGNGFL